MVNSMDMVQSLVMVQDEPTLPTNKFTSNINLTKCEPLKCSHSADINLLQFKYLRNL